MKIKEIEVYIFSTIIVILFLSLLYIMHLFKELPPQDELQDFTPVLSTKVLDRNENLITELFVEKRSWVYLRDIPDNLKLAVLAIEDHKFYKHWGINPKRIVKALLDNIIKRKVMVGGSTITQQLAKIAFLSHKRNLKRKIKELILALYLEHNFSKDEILEMYLNQVYLGHGIYGVQQAAVKYFSKNLNELTLAECALIAGLIRSPMYYSPIKNYEQALQRKNVVLKRMLELKYITKEQFETAKEEKPIVIQTPFVYSKAAYFIEYIKSKLEEEFPQDILYTGGLTIKTTLDINLQKYAEEIFEKHLSQLETSLKSTETIQGALLTMDVKTGQILAMIGGRDFRKSQFNRVTQALRQPGSAFKPIIFLAALEHGFKPNSILEDTPLVFYNNGFDWELISTTTDFTKIDFLKLKRLKVESYQEFIKNLNNLKKENKIWIPENYKNRYYGKVTLRRALELSLNSCAVRLTMELGPNIIIEYARKLDISTPLTNTYSIALGASEVIPIELITAYCAFANNGIIVKPYGIIEIKDRFGNIIKSYTPKEKIVLSYETSYLMTSLLKGVVENGTGKYALNLARTCAGKTGTTNDSTDVWFIGYTPDIICGIWVGYDIKKPLGKDATGGKIACPIWTEFMKFATKDLPPKDFEKPENIIEIDIDYLTGLLPTPYSKKIYKESFIKGTEPKEYSPLYQEYFTEETPTGF